MRVELKRKNGWKVRPSKVEAHDELRYAVVHITRIKQVGVLIRGKGDYKCTKCPGECKHTRAVADTLSGVPA